MQELVGRWTGRDGLENETARLSRFMASTDLSDCEPEHRHGRQPVISTAEWPPIRDKMKTTRATDRWSSDGAVPTKRFDSSDTRYTRRWRGSSNAPCRGRADGICPALHNSHGNGWCLLGGAALLGSSQRPVQESRPDFHSVTVAAAARAFCKCGGYRGPGSECRDSLLIAYIFSDDECSRRF